MQGSMPTAPTAARDPRWALWAAILGSGMAFLDGTVVGVALPVMQQELQATVDAAQWVVEACALSLAALVLAVAALGVLLPARFDAELDGRLARLSLPDAPARDVAAERGKLGGADLSGIDPGVREAVREAFDLAYVAGFRALMLACALLAAGGALAGLLLVEPRSRTAPSPAAPGRPGAAPPG